MTAERILQSDVLDILFEDRNKLYGAYELRRAYPTRIKKAIGGMLFLVAVASASYLFGSGKNENIIAINEYTDTISVSLIDPLKKEKEVAKPPESSAPKEVATVKDNIPQIVPDKEIIKTEVPENTQVDTSAYGDITAPGEATTAGQVVNNNPGTGFGGDGENNNNNTVAPEPIMPTGPIDMRQADEMPEYPGGSRALVQYMVNNLTSELEPGVKYVIKAQFIINEDGNVSEATILSSDDENLNNQVLKTLRKMKKWKPGKYHGRNVAVRFTMPVTFVGLED